MDALPYGAIPIPDVSSNNLSNPKGRVPQVLPVGECQAKLDMNEDVMGVTKEEVVGKVRQP
jgi:hypothetical protein